MWTGYHSSCSLTVVMNFEFLTCRLTSFHLACLCAFFQTYTDPIQFLICLTISFYCLFSASSFTVSVSPPKTALQKTCLSPFSFKCLLVFNLAGSRMESAICPLATDPSLLCLPLQIPLPVPPAFNARVSEPLELTDAFSPCMCLSSHFTPLLCPSVMKETEQTLGGGVFVFFIVLVQDFLVPACPSFTPSLTHTFVVDSGSLTA